MKKEEIEKLIDSASEKIGKENSALVADIFGTMISDNSEMNKELKNKDDEIEKLKKRNDMLTASNGQLLQQVSMGFEEPEKEPEKEEKKPFDFRSAFENGKFKK